MIKFSALMMFGVAAIAATPVDAGPAKRHVAQCRNLSVGDQECFRGERRADPFNVYSYDGRLVGRDPDPNVRMRLRDEDARYRWR